MNKRNWNYFVVGLVGTVSLFSCRGPLPYTDVLLEVPRRPVLPAVEFVDPSNPTAVACLDEQNVEHLILVDIALKGHIKKLEGLLKLCR